LNSFFVVLVQVPAQTKAHKRFLILPPADLQGVSVPSRDLVEEEAVVENAAEMRKTSDKGGPSRERRISAMEHDDYDNDDDEHD
jgi:hypothetical protein